MHEGVDPTDPTGADVDADVRVDVLVARRAELLRLDADDPTRARLPELTRLVARHFDPGHLETRRITLNAPRALLDRIVACESVHTVRSPDDLRNRLDADRRCYAFVHPGALDHPVVVVQIALTLGFVERIADILDTEAPVLDAAAADTAVFYSINSCEPGLAGINLGGALLDRAIQRLAAELPDVGVFATLSPAPDLRAWVLEQLRRDALSDAERALAPVAPREAANRLAADGWLDDGEFTAGMQRLLTAFAVRYLTTRDGTRAVDPVANFHLSNGACVDRVCWMADTSPTGIARSLGIMVSYRYEPERLAERARSYAATGEVVLSPGVLALGA